MNLKKIFVSSVLAALLIPNLAFAEFTDVNESTDYRDAIFWMQEHEVVEGYASGEFGIDNCVTRAEFLKMLYETLELEVVGGEATGFTDVPVTAWHSPYISIAKTQNTVEGYSDGTFRPNQCVNRVEAIKMAVLEFNDNTVPESYRYGYYPYYDDVSEDAWYSDKTTYAFSSGLVGTNHVYDYNFFPAEPMTRKEVAEMLFRMKTLDDHKLSYFSSNYEPSFEEEELFFYDSSCVLDKYDSLASIDTVMPSDASVVFSFDHSDDGQLANLKSIFGKFSDLDSSKALADNYDSSVEDALGYDMVIGEILGGDWEVVVGVSSLENFDTFDEDPDFYIAAKIEKAEEFEKFVGRHFANNNHNDVLCAVQGDAVFWTVAAESFYVVRYGDIFAVTNSAASRDAMLQRFKNGDRFVFGGTLGTYSLVDDAKIFSAFLDFEEIYPAIFGTQSMTASPSYLGSLKNMYHSLAVENDGFRLSSLTEFSSDGVSFLDGYRDYKLSLINKVPADGVIAYFEQPFLFNQSTFGMFGGFPGDDWTEVDELTALLSEQVEITADEVQQFVEMPFAFVLADGDARIPSMSVYSQLDSSTVAVGEKVALAFDGFFDEVIADPEAEVAVQRLNVAGSALRQISVDLNSVPESDRQEMELIFGVGATNDPVNVYYGIHDSNVFVFSTDSNFVEKYGQNTLASDSKYTSAVSKLNGTYGSSVTYLDVSSLLDLVDKYYQATMSDFTTESDMATYNSFMSFFDTFKYFIASSEVDGNVLKQDSFVKVE